MIVGAERAASNISWRREPPRRAAPVGSPAGVYDMRGNQQLELQFKSILSINTSL